jgi:hypothetical protein
VHNNNVQSKAFGYRTFSTMPLSTSLQQLENKHLTLLQVLLDTNSKGEH